MEPRASDENAFIFVVPTPMKWVVPKGYPAPEKYDSKKYAQFRDEVENRGLEQQIKATVSSIESKRIFDRANLYFVVEADQRTGNRLYTALKELDATVLTYLDAEHQKVLVSASEEVLLKYEEHKLPMQIRTPILRIRELQPYEQVTKELETTQVVQSVVVHTMPNADSSVANKYLEQLSSYLTEQGCPITWPAQEGMIVTKMDRDKIYQMIRDSNIVFKIHKLPLGLPSRRRARTVAVPSSLSSANIRAALRVDELPIVCVVDSGLNVVPTLAPYVVERSAGPGFTDEGDGCGNGGHGTPVACLASLGEGSGSARSRIISYKIYSDQENGKAPTGMMEALRQYSDRAKVFVSSINLLADALPFYAKLDELIQKLNVCFVSSAGNIAEELRSRVDEYPDYIPEYAVLHPAQNAHVIGVGAIAKRMTPDCVAPENGLSPFTRCGGNLPRLYDTQKPDLVEHGGNVHRDSLDSNGVGVSSFDCNGAPTDSLAGTSFSAPLVARKLAEIVGRYGHKLKNAEAFKAVLFASCKGRHQCHGCGLPEDFLENTPQQATFLSEGSIRLSDLTQKKVETKFMDRISIPVPSGVRRIDMRLVHSDDIRSVTEPSLDTFLRVNARKTGRPSGLVQPDNTSAQNMKTYTKFFTWSFQRKDMEGIWSFDIVPETTRPISPFLRRDAAVRYGCVITATSITLRPRPLAYYVRREAKKLEGIEFD